MALLFHWYCWSGYLGIGELPFGASVCINVYFIIFLDDYYTFYLIYQLICPHILALYRPSTLNDIDFLQ